MLPLSTMLRATSPVSAWPEPSSANGLGACTGFRVDGVNGRLGTVTGVGVDAVTGDPAWLEVRSGLFVRRTVDVSIDNVVSLDPIAHRIVVTRGRRAKGDDE